MKQKLENYANLNEDAHNEALAPLVNLYKKTYPNY